MQKISPYVTAIRRLHICAGHRVHNHESKCATLHGHNYVFFFHARAAHLDKLGRVIDFSVLKERLDPWLQEHWDHTMILFAEDVETIDLVKRAPGAKQPFILPLNPTAENMGLYLLHTVCPELFKDDDVQIVKIEIFETENCKVEVALAPEEIRA